MQPVKGPDNPRYTPQQAQNTPAAAPNHNYAHFSYGNSESFVEGRNFQQGPPPPPPGVDGEKYPYVDYNDYAYINEVSADSWAKIKRWSDQITVYSLLAKRGYIMVEEVERVGILAMNILSEVRFFMFRAGKQVPFLGASETAKPDPTRRKRWHGQRSSDGYDRRLCHWCGASETPEWRRGPDGPRTLCNACGLKHAKKAKKEGGDKGNANPSPQPTPSSANVAPGTSSPIVDKERSRKDKSFSRPSNAELPEPKQEDWHNIGRPSMDMLSEYGKAEIYPHMNPSMDLSVFGKAGQDGFGVRPSADLSMFSKNEYVRPSMDLSDYGKHDMFSFRPSMTDLFVYEKSLEAKNGDMRARMAMMPEGVMRGGRVPPPSSVHDGNSESSDTNGRTTNSGNAAVAAAAVAAAVVARRESDREADKKDKNDERKYTQRLSIDWLVDAPRTAVFPKTNHEGSGNF